MINQVWKQQVKACKHCNWIHQSKLAIQYELNITFESSQHRHIFQAHSHHSLWFLHMNVALFTHMNQIPLKPYDTASDGFCISQALCLEIWRGPPMWSHVVHAGATKLGSAEGNHKQIQRYSDIPWYFHSKAPIVICVYMYVYIYK